MGKKVKWFSRIGLNREIWKHIKDVDVVLDIGCGVRPQKFLNPKIHYCCEPFKDYCDILTKKYKNNSKKVIINKTAEDVVNEFPKESVDSIFMLDLLEHMEKDAARKVIKKCQEIVRTQVVIFVIIGFVPLDYEKGEKDALGLYGEYWQTHKSAWKIDDFDEKWEILPCKHYAYFDAKGRIFEEPYSVFWAIYNKHDDNRPLVRKPILARLQIIIDFLVGIAVAVLRVLPKSVSQWIIARALKVWYRADAMMHS
jgi:predicted SAM-dependent methyltransferase